MGRAGVLLPHQFHKALLNVFYTIPKFSSNYFLNSFDKVKNSRILTSILCKVCCYKVLRLAETAWQLKGLT